MNGPVSQAMREAMKDAMTERLMRVLTPDFSKRLLDVPGNQRAAILQWEGLRALADVEAAFNAALTEASIGDYVDSAEFARRLPLLLAGGEETALYLLRRMADVNRMPTAANVVDSPAPKRQRNGHYVTILQSQSDDRHNLWTEYFYLKVAEAAGKRYSRRRGENPPTSQEWFVIHVRDAEGKRLSLREFRKWFAVTKTHRVGGTQDLRIRAMIQGEIDRLRSAGYSVSHGKE